MENIDLQKPLIQATLGDLRELLLSLPIDENTQDTRVKKHYVYGLAGLAELLGCAKTTACRIKASGVLDKAISQRGKIIAIDADYALELLKIKKHNK